MPATGLERRTSRRLVLEFAATLACVSVVGCGPPPRGTIGAVLLRQRSGRVYIRDVPPHLAAAKAGIQVGDELLLIEGQDVRRLGDDDLRRLLSGGVGEPVKLTLARGSEVLRVTLRRSMAEPYRLE